MVSGRIDLMEAEFMSELFIIRATEQLVSSIIV